MTLTPYVADPDFTLYHGDVRQVLPQLESESVDCALTSPPFYGLRDYGVDGQIGLEASPDAWVAELVAVFRAVRRVLRPEGTLWVECGDSYNAGTSTSRVGSTLEGSHGYWAQENATMKRVSVRNGKVKDQAQEERAGTTTAGRNNASFGRATHGDLAPHLHRVPQAETLDGGPGESPRGPDGRRATHVKKGEHSLQHRDGDRWPNEQRHPRSVWTIPTQGFPEAHFATWPEALVERIIKAGCPEDGMVLDPFMGSGTTALVARRLGRKSVGVELNGDYAAMCARRLGQQSLLAEGAA